MTEPPGIRAAKLNDAAEIARLCRETGYPASGADVHDRLALLLGIDTRLIAVAPGPGTTLLGWAAVEHRCRLESGESAVITGLVVDQGSRRRGVGRALVAALAEWATARRLTRITMSPDAAGTGTQVFCRSLGFAGMRIRHEYVKRLFPG